MSDFRNYLDNQLQDPEFREAYEALQPERELRKQLMDARIKFNITQKELADRMGVKQSNISRFENGKATPTLDFMQRVAKAMGKTLKIEFV